MTNDVERYESYEGFLKTAIKRYWTSDKSSRLDLLAILLATREAWGVAWDEVEGRGKTILKGAAGVTAVTVLLRGVLSGPLGLLLTGMSVASLVALYVKHHEQIWKRVSRYGELNTRYREQYKEVHAELTNETIRKRQYDLMVDGLMVRFVEELEEVAQLEPVKDDA